MLLIAVAWIYVVLMVAVVEATGPQGSLLGAIFTLLLYGALPLSIVGYLVLFPARRRARRAAEAAAAAAGTAAGAAAASETDLSDPPDQRGHPAGAAVAPKREET